MAGRLREPLRGIIRQPRPGTNNPEGRTTGRACPEVIAAATLGLLRCFHAQFAVFPGGDPDCRDFGTRRRLLRKRAHGDRRRNRPAVPRVHLRARRDPARVRRRGALRSTGVRRDRRDAAARSTPTPASSIPKSYAQMRERQEGRYYGLGITILPRRRRHHGDVDLRRVARLSRRGCAAATSSRASKAPMPRARRATKRCAS